MIEHWVKDIVEHNMPAALSVGQISVHPSGRVVQITGGQYWGQYGLSNFWRWRECKPDGSLGPIEHGYGW